MSDIYVDATTLIALGQIGELDLLTCFDREPYVLQMVAAEVTTEPARTNLQRFQSSESVETMEVENPLLLKRSRSILGNEGHSGDISLIAVVYGYTEIYNTMKEIAVVSDDKRVRTVARGLEATVTGTIGVVVRAVEEREMTAEEGKDLVRRLDSHGLHMTGELREKAYDLVDEAANER